MKKAAVEAWEKNKDKIRKYMATSFNSFDNQVDFVESILEIAYKGESTLTKVHFERVDKFLIMFFLLFPKGYKRPTIIYTKYSICNFSIYPNISLDEKCYIAQQIVLTAVPVNFTSCAKEWTEEFIDRKWAGIAHYGGLII